jgi:hypothetical protein
MLRPGARDAVGREDSMRLLAELGDVQGRLDDLKRRLRELAEHVGAPVGSIGRPDVPVLLQPPGH